MSDKEDTVILREQTLHTCSSIVLGQRKDQQDSLNIMEKDANTKLCIIADGMGGLKGGKLASSSAVNAFCGHFMDDEITNIPSFLYNQAIACDHMIADMEDVDGNPLQAGSTLVAAYVHENQLNFVSVGDSRLYLFRKSIAKEQKEGFYRGEAGTFRHFMTKGGKLKSIWLSRKKVDAYIREVNGHN